MPEYWKSYKRIWCEYCRIFYLDNAINRRNHENSPKHKEKLKLKVDAMRRKAEMDEDSASSTAKRVSYYGSDATTLNTSNLVFQSGNVPSVANTATATATFDASKIMSSSASTTKIEGPIYLDPSDSILGSWTQVEETEEARPDDHRQIPTETGWTGSNKTAKKDAPKLPLKLKSVLPKSDIINNAVMNNDLNAKDTQDKNNNTLSAASPQTATSLLTSLPHFDDTTTIRLDNTTPILDEKDNFPTKSSLRRSAIRKRED